MPRSTQLNTNLSTGIARRARHALRSGAALAPEASPTVGDGPEPDVYLQVLGGLSISVLGERVLPRGRARDLLVELLARGGRDVAASAVASSLWPHGELDYALGALNTTLYRMRRQPGMRGLVTLVDGRLDLDATRCDSDAWMLEAALRGAVAHMELGAAARDVTGLERWLALVVTLYQGPLLEQDDSHSTRRARDRLRLRLVNVMGRADTRLAQLGAGQRGWLGKIAAVDPCPELLRAVRGDGSTGS